MIGGGEGIFDPYEETSKRKSEAGKNYKPTIETIKKISDSCWGKKKPLQTEEHKRKMSISQKIRNQINP